MGLSRHTGERIDEGAHIRQSIIDILTTPMGTRVMRRSYGSRLHELVDRPMTSALKADVYQATADALVRWEPRVRVRRVRIDAIQPGALELSVDITSPGLGNSTVEAVVL